MTGPWIAAIISLWLLVLLIGLGVIGLVRRMIGVLERVEELVSQQPPGAPPLTEIPPFEVVDEAGRRVSSVDLIGGVTIVLFMESRCKPCRALATSLRESGGTVDGLPILVVADEVDLGRRIGLPPEMPIFRQEGRSVAKLFMSTATPHAFVVDDAGVVLDRAVPRSAADLTMLADRQRGRAKRDDSVLMR